MAHFQVYQDEDDGETRRLKINAGKLCKSKVGVKPRHALGELNVNQVLGAKGQVSNRWTGGKHCGFQYVSEAFKQVKLNTEADEKVDRRVESEPGDPAFRSSSTSNISLDVSFIETDNFSPYEVKAYTESLYDCLTYRDDIYNYLRDLELKRRPKPFYMKKQPNITYAMRSTLVDWLVEVTEEYRLQGGTLFTAVSYVDRFLSIMAVVCSKLQLVGTSAMFVAAKYEEIFAPDVNELTYITDNAYTKNQVLKMEQLILKTLNFEISVPTHHTFITHLSKVADIEHNVVAMALYICELCLVEGDPYLQFPPSFVACGALALARHCFNYVDAWPDRLAKISGYSLRRHLSKVLPYINETHKKAPTIRFPASRNKYKSSENYGVSLISHKSLNI